MVGVSNTFLPHSLFFVHSRCQHFLVAALIGFASRRFFGLISASHSHECSHGLLYPRHSILTKLASCQA